jgi:hypothetical protein
MQSSKEKRYASRMVDECGYHLRIRRFSTYRPCCLGCLWWASDGWSLEDQFRDWDCGTSACAIYHRRGHCTRETGQGRADRVSCHWQSSSSDFGWSIPSYSRNMLSKDVNSPMSSLSNDIGDLSLGKLYLYPPVPLGIDPSE